LIFSKDPYSYTEEHGLEMTALTKMVVIDHQWRRADKLAILQEVQLPDTATPFLEKPRRISLPQICLAFHKI